MTTKWDLRFLELAELIGSWSKDPSTKCGAVIVRPDKTIAGTGFNGFPQACLDEEEIIQDRDLKLARTIHAEMNAILQANEKLHGYTIYIHSAPTPILPSCDRCAAHIIQAGIKRVVCKKAGPPSERWQDSVARGLQMYREAGVDVWKVDEGLRRKSGSS